MAPTQKKSTVSATAPAPAPETPVVTPKVVKPKQSKAATSEPVVAPAVPASAPPTDGAPADTVVDVVSQEAPAVEMSALAVLEEKFTALTVAMKEVVSQMRVVKKEHDALRRVAERVEKKRANARTTPNGFAKPTKISDELCAFLKVPAGSEKSRTDVTREIHKYIKTNSLFNAENKRIILADPVLKKLLSLKDGVEVTYFNLQSFLKHHFIKDQTPAVAVVA